MITPLANDWKEFVQEVEAQTIPVLSPLELFNKIKTYIMRYVVLSQPAHADVITLWIMHTWVVDCADFTPYVYVHSPVMRCGKTQVHRIVEPLSGCSSPDRPTPSKKAIYL